MNFKKVTPTNLSDSIVDQIINLIVQGDLKPGDKLPSERELTDILGVSRTSVREAVKTLVRVGVFKSIPGKGVYLSKTEDDQSVSALAYPLLLTNDFEDLFYARELIQVDMARQAAKKASEADISSIEEAIEKAKTAETREEQAECDVQFDIAVAKAANNYVLLKFLMSIQEYLKLTQLKFITLDRYQKAIYDHTRILEFIKKGKADEAAEAMRIHLLSVKNSIEDDI